MRPSPVIRYRLLLPLALVVPLVVVAPPLAVSPASAEADRVAREDAARDEGPVAVGAGLDLSVASLQARVKKLEAANPAPDDAISEALRAYGSAVDQLALASEWRQRADALSRLQREGPRTLESIRREADAWSAQATSPLAADASQTDLEAMLAETEAKLSVVRKGLLDVDAEQAQLADRRLSLPAELAAASAAREGSLGEIGLPPLPTGSVESTLARRAQTLATQKAAAEQAGALELELSTQEMRRELLTARRELLRRKADTWSERVTELQNALAQRRLKEAQETADEARADQEQLARVHPILGSLAEENARLTAERAGEEGLTAKMEAASRRLTAVGEQLQNLEERSKGVRQKVAAAGLTDAIGLLLRKEKEDLPEVDRTRAEIRARRQEISDVQLESLNLEDLLKALPAAESEVEQILQSQASSLAPEQRAKIEASARNVLKTRRSYLDALIRDSNAYFATLVDLDAKESELVRLLDDYNAFLDQHVLWIPNTSPPDWKNIRDWRDALVWLADPQHLRDLARRLLSVTRSSPIASSFGLLLLLVAIAWRRRLKRIYAALCDGSGGEQQLLPRPLAALLITALLALPGPFALWMSAWMLNAAPQAPDDFATATAAALSSIALPLFVTELLRRATSKNGLAARFLQWPQAPLALARGQIVFLETVALPAYALAVFFDAQPQEDWSEAVGRMAFCLAVGAGGIAAHRLFSPSGHLVEQVLRRTDLEWTRPLLSRASWLPSTIAVVVIGIALVGYYYTALVLLQRLWLSALVLLTFMAANAAVLRWLASKQEAPPRKVLPDGEAAGAVESDAEDDSVAEAVTRVSAQTRSLLRVVFGVALFLAMFSVWVDVFPALRFFEKVELYEVSATIEKAVGSGDQARMELVPTQVPVTVANVMYALLGAAMALVGARNLPGLLELVLLSRLRLDRGLRYAIATVTRYVVFIAGTVFALQNLGVGWSNVQWLVAAISVGLGFGLQEIFGNFVSGLILLFERPVRVGDMVTIDQTTGVVTRIEMRATTVIDADRRELIVPNKELITGKLVNWSLNDSTVRLVLPVGVAYGSEPVTVERLLLEAAKQCATVLEHPEPMAVFMRFGDSALEFELRVFLANPDHLVPTRHELLVAIERKLRSASIEIPFPQRDLHLRSVDAEAAALLGTPPQGAASSGAKP